MQTCAPVEVVDVLLHLPVFSWFCPPPPLKTPNKETPKQPFPSASFSLRGGGGSAHAHSFRFAFRNHTSGVSHVRTICETDGVRVRSPCLHLNMEQCAGTTLNLPFVGVTSAPRNIILFCVGCLTLLHAVAFLLLLICVISVHQPARARTPRRARFHGRLSPCGRNHIPG